MTKTSKKASAKVEKVETKMGRPEVVIDMVELETFCRMKPTLYDCARYFKCSEDTIERRIKERFNVTFAEFRDQSLVHTKFKLIQDALGKADPSKPGYSEKMHTLALKNMSDWRERTDVTSDGKELQAPPAQVTIVLPSNGREGSK